MTLGHLLNRLEVVDWLQLIERTTIRWLKTANRRQIVSPWRTREIEFWNWNSKFVGIFFNFFPFFSKNNFFPKHLKRRNFFFARTLMRDVRACCCCWWREVGFNLLMLSFSCPHFYNKTTATETSSSPPPPPPTTPPPPPTTTTTTTTTTTIIIINVLFSMFQ